MFVYVASMILNIAVRPTPICCHDFNFYEIISVELRNIDCYIP